MTWLHVPAAAAVAVLLAGLSGCETIGYLGQSVSGHFDVVSRERDIDEVLADPATAADLRDKLSQVAAVRSFARETLALPDNGSYRTYADLGRPYVTWTAVVTPALSLAPKQWCFPVTGCVAYRGYFDEGQAQAFAARFDPAQFDTHVGGATAYSTLGWFSDPVLNTMITRGEVRMVSVIFHELAHQRLYVSGDTTFNESYAVAVERFGLRRWFEATGRADFLARLDERDQRRQEFRNLVAAARQQLGAVYASGLPPEDKLSAKADVFTWMHAQHASLRAGWGGRSPYDAWFARPLNNARIALVNTYGEYVDAFLGLYESVERDPIAFHQRSAALAKLDRESRRRELESLRSRKGGADVASAMAMAPPRAAASHLARLRSP